MQFQVRSLALAALAALCAAPAPAEIRYFGYAAVSCGHDDPHDADTRTDYLDEVKGFSNISHICADADPAVTADRLRRTRSAGLRPLLYVEPAFFSRSAAGLAPLAPEASAAVWAAVREGVAQSGVAADDIIFYIADEPIYFGLGEADLSRAADIIRADFPRSKLLMIEGWNANGPPPVPAFVDYWGFDAYGVPDPALEPRYGAFLDAAKATMRPGQELVMVMEAFHHPALHPGGAAGEASLARIAMADYLYAFARGDIAMILAYTWPGGIDSIAERGIRDLSPVVRAQHERIGRAIIGRD